MLGGAVEGAEKLLDPDRMLYDVIRQMSEENQYAQVIKARSKSGEDSAAVTALKTQQSEEFLLGLMYLAGQILEAFDSGESGNAKDVEDVNAEMNAGQKQRAGLINEIFTRFLFPMVFGEDGSASSQSTMRECIEQKMKKRSAGSQQSRKGQTDVAYKVLLGLVKRDLKLMDYFMKSCLQPVVEKIQRSDTWTYQPPTQSAIKSDYVGLRNPGCLCYMNSMNQQFFMVPPLRYNLLTVDDGKEEDLKPYKNDQVDDNVLHQY